MACSPAFPSVLPTDCLATLAGIVVRKELSARRLEAAYAGWQVQGYVMGALITQPAGNAGTLSNTAPMTDEEAGELLTKLASDAPAHTITETTLRMLANWLVTLLLERLA